MSEEDMTNLRNSGGKFTDHEHFMRVIKRRSIESKKKAQAIIEYLNTLDEQLLSEMAAIKAKIDQVHSDFEVNGQKLVDAFRSRSAEYENKLKSESEKFNKIFQEFCNYRTSYEEIYVDVFQKFNEEKRNFNAQLLEMRKKEEALLATIDSHLKKVDETAERRKMVYEDLRVVVALDVAAPAAQLEAVAIDAAAIDASTS